MGTYHINYINQPTFIMYIQFIILLFVIYIIVCVVSRLIRRATLRGAATYRYYIKELNIEYNYVELIVSQKEESFLLFQDLIDRQTVLHR